MYFKWEQFSIFLVCVQNNVKITCRGLEYEENIDYSKNSSFASTFLYKHLCPVDQKNVSFSVMSCGIPYSGNAMQMNQIVTTQCNESIVFLA